MDADHTVQKWLQGSGRDETREMISNNSDVLIETAIAVAGTALQPTFIAGAAIREGKLKVVLPEHEPEPMVLYAVYAHRQLLASKVPSFVDFIDSFFGEPPYWDRFK
ncbi:MULTISPECIES: LysR substrate-binding domain-containing protein [Gammaproteobacteria]|uniref:LysR substrate-binding domain-containing protein n=1 Tax=Gammaproteobacteria TaxID=1236 RepID=UPI001B2FEEFE|nr:MULTISPECIES: LysR substrate-binding domain-containing protein [Gammaproteobacteria]